MGRNEYLAAKSCFNFDWRSFKANFKGVRGGQRHRRAKGGHGGKLCSVPEIRRLEQVH